MSQRRHCCQLGVLQCGFVYVRFCVRPSLLSNSIHCPTAVKYMLDVHHGTPVLKSMETAPYIGFIMEKICIICHTLWMSIFRLHSH